MKNPPFPRISQSDCNAEQCEFLRTKNKRSQSAPVDGGPLTESVISHENFPIYIYMYIYSGARVENVKPAHFGKHYFFTEVGFKIQFDFFWSVICCTELKITIILPTFMASI